MRFLLVFLSGCLYVETTGNPKPIGTELGVVINCDVTIWSEPKRTVEIEWCAAPVGRYTEDVKRSCLEAFPLRCDVTCVPSALPCTWENSDVWSEDKTD